jgi:Bacterial regulatory proteins, crp family
LHHKAAREVCGPGTATAGGCRDSACTQSYWQIQSLSSALVIAKRPTHQELAGPVGASRETVTRVFTRLAPQGEIALRGCTMVLRQSFLEHLGHRLG